MKRDSRTHTRGALAPPGFLLSAAIGAALCVATTGDTAAAEEVERIEVVGQPPSEARRRAPTAFVDEIRFDPQQVEIETAPEVLAQRVGVQVRRFGGLGSFATISIRGSDSNQVHFYIDGVPVSQAQNETVNLSNLPLDALERMEVYRGTVPIHLSGSATSAVNLITRAPSPTANTEIKARYGSLQTRQLSATHTQQMLGFDLLAHLTYLGSKGDFDFRSDNGTLLNPDDDRDEARRNNDFDAVNAIVRVARSLSPSADLDLSQEFLFKDRGVPGGANSIAHDTSLQNLRSLTSLRLRARALGGTPNDVTASLYGTYQQQDFDDPRGAFGAVLDTRNQTTSAGARVGLDHYGLPWQSIGVFTDVAWQTFSPHNQNSRPPDGPDQSRLRVALAAQDVIALLDDRLTIVPSLRYQHIRDRQSGEAGADPTGQPQGPTATRSRDLFGPAIGISLAPFDALTLRANLGRFERAPNFSELFGNSGTVKPASELRPETATNRDVGFSLHLAPTTSVDAQLEYAYFNNDIDDLISFTRVRADRFEAVNFSDARLRGHEISLRLTLFDHLRWTANYTHQQTRNLSSDANQRGKRLPLVPDDEVFSRLELFDDDRTLYYELTYVGDSFAGATNLRRTPGRHFHTAGATWRALEWLALNIEANNFTDNEVRDVLDFPLPGAVLLGSIRIDLS